MRGPTALVQPFFGGDWHAGEAQEVVVDKYSGDPATTVELSSRLQVDAAVAAVVAAQAGSSWDPPARYRVLAGAAAALVERADDFVAAIVADTGFTLGDARREVARAAETLLLSGEEAKRLAGEVVPLDGAPGGQGRIGFTVHHPVGVVCAITPFNSPLNTVAHKVGPALAAGNGVVLKPAGPTPRTADKLLRLLLDAGLPEGLMAVLYGAGSTVGQQLLEDPRLAFYAFTGSTEVGEHVHRVVGLRRTQLEMGSLSSTIVCADARLEDAVDRIVNAGFRKAGQVCTSVQRVYVARAAVDEVSDRLAAAVGALSAGDPNLEATQVGPLISRRDAERVHGWIGEAVAAGAQIVAGGGVAGTVVDPTVLAGVDTGMAVMSREIFGPVVVLRPFDDLAGAIDEINDTPYGLAAGIFTRDLDAALAAAARLRMGSVHVNETSSSRVDLMPYTGVKRSGLGREGPRYAVREMSEERLVTIGTSGR